MERVTQPALQVQQLVGFCWVRPAETFDGFVSEAYAARRWPCGGFFYFFDQSEQPEQQPLEEAPLAVGEARRPCGSEWVDWRALSCKPRSDRHPREPKHDLVCRLILPRSYEPFEEDEPALADMRPSPRCACHPGPFLMALLCCLAVPLRALGVGLLWLLGQVGVLCRHLKTGDARRQEMETRAAARALLLRPLAQKLTVRVEGVLPSSASHDEITWYRLREEIDHRIDRTAWLKIKSEDEVFTRYQDVWSTYGLSSQDAADEDEALQERISHVLLPAKTRRRRLEMEDRIEVFTPTKEGVEIGPVNGPVVADARFWRQLRVRHDLGPSSAPASRLRVRPFGPSIFGFDDCWQLTPLEKELNPERHVAKDELCRQLERALTKLEKRLGACMSLLAAPCSACTLPLRHYLRCACLQREQLPPPLTVGMSVILGGFVGCSIVALHGDGSVDVHIPGCGIRPRVARTSLRLLDGSPAPPATAPQASRSPWMSCMDQIWSGWVWVPPPVSATASQISPTATVDSSASTDTTEARRAVQALRDALRHEPVVLNSTPPSKCEHSEGPRLMHLVLPLSCMHSSVSRTRRSTAEGVSEGIGIGIGAELYFMQLITLGWVFLLMGLVSLGSMLNNYFVYFKLHSTALGSWEPNVTAVDVILQGLTIGANTGQRGTPFNLLQVGCSELVTTLVFLLYLIWLKQFNAERELALKKSALSAADYTIQVRGLHTLRPRTWCSWCGREPSSTGVSGVGWELGGELGDEPSLKGVSEEDVAKALAGIVQRSWAADQDGAGTTTSMAPGDVAGERERGWWYGRHALDMAMRVPLTESEKRESALARALQLEESVSPPMEASSHAQPNGDCGGGGCCAERKLSLVPGWSSIVFSVQNWGSFLEPGVFDVAHEPAPSPEGAPAAMETRDVELASSYSERYALAASSVQSFCGTIRDWFAPTKYVASTAFVTFRYAADADEAIRAIGRLRRAPCRRVCSVIIEPIRQCICGAQTSFHGLHARRAPEVDDVIWKNLWHDTWMRRHVRPLASNAFYISCCTIFFMFILSMTHAKLSLAMGVGLDETFSDDTDPSVYDEAVLWIFETLGLGYLDEQWVLVTALFFSLLIKILNDLLLSPYIVNLVPNPLRGAEWMVRKERLPSASREQLRLMTLITVVYITNYVIVLFIAHTPLAQRHETLVSLLKQRTGARANDLDQSRLYMTDFLSGCFDQVNEHMWMAVRPPLCHANG